MIERRPDRENRNATRWPAAWGEPPAGATPEMLRNWAERRIVEAQIKRAKGEPVGRWLGPDVR